MQRHIALRVLHTLWKHYLPDYLSRTCDTDNEHELVIEAAGCSVGIVVALLSILEDQS